MSRWKTSQWKMKVSTIQLHRSRTNTTEQFELTGEQGHRGPLWLKNMQKLTIMVFPFMHRLNPFTSARNSLFTGTRRTLILKYSAALSYAECADSAIILYNNIFLPWRQQCKLQIFQKKKVLVEQIKHNRSLSHISGFVIPFFDRI